MADEQLFSGGEVIWPLTDMQNTTRDLVAGYGSGSSGTPGLTVRNHLAYDSFGTVTPTASTLDYLFVYTGMEYDWKPACSTAIPRYYDSANGEWISEDPIEFAGGDANLGRWVGNQANCFHRHGYAKEFVMNGTKTFTSQDLEKLVGHSMTWTMGEAPALANAPPAAPSRLDLDQ